MELHQLHHAGLDLGRLRHLLGPSKLRRPGVALPQQALELLLDLVHLVLGRVRVVQQILAHGEKVAGYFLLTQKTRGPYLGAGDDAALAAAVDVDLVEDVAVHEHQVVAHALAQLLRLVASGMRRLAAPFDDEL